MRTTVNIEDGQLRLAKELADRTHRSLGDVVTEALAMLLAYERGRPRSRSVDLPVFDGRPGLQPGVDLEDKEALMDLLDMPDLPGDGDGDGGAQRREAGPSNADATRAAG